MKEKLVRVVRRALPPGAVQTLEDSYRRARVTAVSARYGNPSRHLKVIAVTGTNGKTTTINYLNEILKQAGFSTAMFSTAVIEVAGDRILNELNATVASTTRMQQFFRDAKKAKVDYVVLEITSHSLHQHKLDGVPIEAAIMTNLTQDHLDYHKTMDDYAAAKGLLFQRDPRFIVLNHDDEWFDFFDNYEASEQKMTYGESKGSEARISDVALYKRGSQAVVTFDHQTKLELASHLPGRYNISNFTAAATAAYLLGVDVTTIQEGIANLKEVPGRFERAVTGKDYEVIVDYAHTPDALEKLLETARAITKNRVILVFGATGDRDKGKRPIMGKIAAEKADRIFVTDEESYNEDPEVIRKAVLSGIEEVGVTAKAEEIADRKDAIKKALSIATKGDTILITGMGHEKFRIVNGERLPWNDSEVVRELLGEK